jgi:hypothetical protein
MVATLGLASIKEPNTKTPFPVVNNSRTQKKKKAQKKKSALVKGQNSLIITVTLTTFQRDNHSK